MGGRGASVQDSPTQFGLFGYHFGYFVVVSCFFVYVGWVSPSHQDFFPERLCSGKAKNPQFSSEIAGFLSSVVPSLSCADCVRTQRVANGFSGVPEGRRLPMSGSSELLGSVIGQVNAAAQTQLIEMRDDFPKIGQQPSDGCSGFRGFGCGT